MVVKTLPSSSSGTYERMQKQQINADQKWTQKETDGDQYGSKMETKTIETGITCNATARKFCFPVFSFSG